MEYDRVAKGQMQQGRLAKKWTEVEWVTKELIGQ